MGGLSRYERTGPDGEVYIDAVAAEADLKALHQEVVGNRNANVDDVLDIDPSDPLHILAEVMASDWLVAQRREAAREALLEAADAVARRIRTPPGVEMSKYTLALVDIEADLRDRAEIAGAGE